MSETAADEQDLAKALDSVANAASGLGDPTTTTTDTTTPSVVNGGVSLPPIVPLDSSATPAFTPPSPVSSFASPSQDTTSSVSPLIQPFHSTSDESSSTDAPEVSQDVVSSFTSPVESVESPSDDSTTSRDDVVSHPDSASAPTGPLADIKSEALNELRPLVDKLNVSPEEKFDTYLLLIRSTDDMNLIAPAHEAAKSIQDEARRAEALLDIIKEIDYLSRQEKSSN